jgi:DNA-binding PadR family transcriptional regulator
MILGIRQYQILKRLLESGPKASVDFKQLPILRNTVFTVLVNLEGKGLVTSAFTAPERRRGGKAKREFEITEAGKELVRKFETFDLKL